MLGDRLGSRAPIRLTSVQLAWLLGSLVVGTAFLALRAAQGSFMEIAGVSISVVNLGEIGLVCLIGSTAYIWRKRLAIGATGRLETWLWTHVSLGLLGGVFIWLHSRWRFSPSEWLPNAAMLLMFATILTGLGGRLLFVVMAGRLRQLSNYDPPDVLQVQMAALEREAEAIAGFKSSALRSVYEHLTQQSQSASWPPAEPQVRHLRTYVPAAEQQDLDRLIAIVLERTELTRVLGERLRYRRLLDIWWRAHSRLTEAAWMLAGLHVLASLLIDKRWS